MRATVKGALAVVGSALKLSPCSSMLISSRAVWLEGRHEGVPMCGIAGYLSQTGTAEPVGRVLLDMLTGLARRGPDSAGIACFRPDADGTTVAWVRVPEG